ncbi:MAG: hypothetical protein Q9216_005812 [Gyalolechia sp. 2 TL-2023]
MPLEDIKRSRQKEHTWPLAISDLPNEDVIVRIVHQRLLLAASLEDRKLILECYHPSAQYTEPYVFCDYLGTPGLSDEREGQGSLYQDIKVEKGQLKHLYSRFRPSRAEAGGRSSWAHPAGDVSGSRTKPAEQVPALQETKERPEFVTHKVFLDAHELFTQLSITAALVQTGPRRGVFLSFIDIIDKKTQRVWRDWLAEEAKRSTNNDHKSQHSETERSDMESDSIIWADQGKTLGLKARVKETTMRKNAPILLHRDELGGEDLAVSYSLELKELLISTTHLLLAVEKSLLERRSEGKAMIFGSFLATTSSDAAAS